MVHDGKNPMIRGYTHGVCCIILLVTLDDQEIKPACLIYRKEIDGLRTLALHGEEGIVPAHTFRYCLPV